MGGIFSNKPKPKKDRPAPNLIVINTPGTKKEDPAKEKTYTFKVLTIGDCGVGKSALNYRYANGTFQENSDRSGYDLLSKSTTVDNSACLVKIWDTAGQERFNTITASFYRGAHVIIIAFDLTNKQTYDNLQQWIQEADRFGDKEALKLIIGTKSDLESEKMVNTDDAQQFCSQHGITFIETSAKTGHNVDYVFTTACHEMLEAIKKGTYFYDEEAQ